VVKKEEAEVEAEEVIEVVITTRKAEEPKKASIKRMML